MPDSPSTSAAQQECPEGGHHVPMSDGDQVTCRYCRTPMPSAAVPVPGWYNVTRDRRAHYITNGYPLCQLSDIGEPIPRNPGDRDIERVCEDCRAIYKARVTMAVRKAARQP